MNSPDRDPPEAPPPTPEPGREAARAYLDLWERNLVQLAASGPPPAPRR